MFKFTLSHWRNRVFLLSRIVRGQFNESSGCALRQSLSQIIRVSKVMEEHSKDTIKNHTDLFKTNQFAFV